LAKRIRATDAEKSKRVMVSDIKVRLGNGMGPRPIEKPSCPHVRSDEPVVKGWSGKVGM
jgi:hypothetical protein